MTWFSPLPVLARSRSSSRSRSRKPYRRHMAPEKRSEIARAAAKARWKNISPDARRAFAVALRARQRGDEWENQERGPDGRFGKTAS